MLTVAVLRSWLPEQLPRAGNDLEDSGALLGRLAGDVGVAVGEMAWRSPAADAAHAAADDLCLALRTLRESFTMQAEAVHRAGAALTAAQDLLRRAARLADDHGLYLFADGSVSSPPVPNQLDGVTALSAARSVIDGVVRQESVGHSAYLTDDTTSQYGMAAVVAGLPELVPHDDGFGLGDTLWWTP